MSVDDDPCSDPHNRSGLEGTDAVAFRDGHLEPTRTPGLYACPLSGQLWRQREEGERIFIELDPSQFDRGR